MKFITKLFQKKRAEKKDMYAYMGSLGVSPHYMKMYQDAVEKMKKHDKE